MERNVSQIHIEVPKEMFERIEKHFTERGIRSKIFRTLIGQYLNALEDTTFTDAVQHAVLKTIKRRCSNCGYIE